MAWLIAHADPVSLLTIVLVAGATLLILRRPMAGLIALVVVVTTLPFGVLPLRLVVAPTFVDLLLTLVLLAWLLPQLRHRLPFRATPLDGPLVALIGSAVVSFCLGQSYAPLSAEDTRLFLKLVNSTLLFFGVIQIAGDEARVEPLVRTLVLSGIAASLVALVLYTLPRESAAALLSSLGALGYPVGPDVVRTIAGTETVRAIGTSIDPNVLGGVMMVATLVVGGQVVARAPVLPRPILVAGLVPLAATLALTYSRSAWVGTALGAVYLGVFHERRLLLAGIAGLGATLLLPQTQPLVERFVGALELRDQATLMRLDEYRNALEIIARYPLFGIGFGGAPRIELAAGVSSMYLLVAEQMGLVGLGLLLLVLGLAVRHGFRRAVGGLRGVDPRPGGAAAGFRAALMGALVVGLFDHYFFNLRFPHMVALFWMLVALVVATGAAVARPRA